MREWEGRNRLSSVMRTKETGMGGTSASADEEVEDEDEAVAVRVPHTDEETEKMSMGRSTTQHVPTASETIAVSVARRERWCGSA